MDILDDIIRHKAIEVAEAKGREPYSALERRLREMADAGELRPTVSMRASLAASPTGIISEFKRRSPSKGWIHEDASLVDTVTGYSAAGASALSILTDEKFFGGRLEFIETVRPLVQTPILRKDFIIDEYQLLEARIAGADAVLLIAAALPQDVCARLARFAHELGLETLLELHCESELGYITDTVDMVGVNNRNLGTFHVDVDNSRRLARLLPEDKLKVSESGISNPETIKSLREIGYRGFLIGETFMRTANPPAALQSFIKALQ